MRLVFGGISKYHKEHQEELQKLENIVDKTNITPIKTIGKNFIEGHDDIFFMLYLPRITLMHSIVHSEELVDGLQVCAKYAKDRDIEDLTDKVIDDLTGELRNKLSKAPLIKGKKIENNINKWLLQLAFFGRTWH